jgi:hypothetical protein
MHFQVSTNLVPTDKDDYCTTEDEKKGVEFPAGHVWGNRFIILTSFVEASFEHGTQTESQLSTMVHVINQIAGIQSALRQQIHYSNDDISCWPGKPTQVHV